MLIRYAIEPVIALVLFLGFLPFLLTISLVLWALSKESPFFFQLRTGKNEVPFLMWKLKTLYPNHSVAARLGDFLRRYHIDEIPQLWHIVTGKMSFIGPRPLPHQYLPLYSPKHRQRFLLKPGLTGLSQIKGGNALCWKHRLDWDIVYLKKHCLRLDLYIVCATLYYFIQLPRHSYHHSQPLQADYLHRFSSK